MTNELPTIYKIDHYYTSGEGSSEDSFTTKEEALKAFHALVEEIKEEWTAEDDVIDYAKLWSCKQEEDEDEDETDEENILFWTFTYGFTDYDPPCE